MLTLIKSVLTAYDILLCTITISTLPVTLTVALNSNEHVLCYVILRGPSF